MEIKNSRTLCRVLWQRILDNQSIEHCGVIAGRDGFAIGGHITAAHEGQPLDVGYYVRCGQDWAADSVDIRQLYDGEVRHMKLARTKDGWQVDRAPDPRLDGCAEPDLGLTPSTNALAIRRLDLAIGHGAEIKCAWVKFPALTIEPALQRYERLGEREYRYTNVASGFTATVTVDELALPIAYEGIWTRIADWQGDAAL